MIAFEDIRSVRLETSTYCNAACPLCPRNLFGYPYNAGYTEKHLSLLEVQTMFDKDFVAQLDQVVFEGNFGDPMMNPHVLELAQHFKDCLIEIHTNGSLQPSKTWQQLAGMNSQVHFGIDGLEDTHSIYRQKTDWNKIIRNAETYIHAGGYAVWKMILFDHNRHQVEECQKMSEDLGFSHFALVEQGRTEGPVFDENKQLIRVLGDFKGSTNIDDYINNIESGEILIEDLWDEVNTNISCDTITNQEIYINVEGEVFPCCFMGFNPQRYGKGQWHEPVNKQIANLISTNNALQRPLKECIEWFKSVSPCWNKTSFETGRLIVCDHNCGKKNLGRYVF